MDAPLKQTRLLTVKQVVGQDSIPDKQKELTSDTDK